MRKQLFVGCMPFRYTQHDLTDLLKPYGEIHGIKFFSDWENATHDAYAHVDMDVTNMTRLILEIDGKAVGDRIIRINEVVTRQDTRVFAERC